MDRSPEWLSSVIAAAPFADRCKAFDIHKKFYVVSDAGHCEGFFTETCARFRMLLLRLQGHTVEIATPDAPPAAPTARATR